MKNYHMDDLVRVVEAGAIAASNWVGRGNKEAADKAATDAIRHRLNQLEFSAEIAIGEGVKDKSFGLFKGELVGLHAPRAFVPEETNSPKSDYSISIDPIEGTNPVSKGGYEAISVLAMAKYGCFYQTEHFYMNKIAVGPEVIKNGNVLLDYPVRANIENVAHALGKSVDHVTVCVLDRPRTQPLVEQLRKVGCRIKFISDCDVTACIATCEPDSGIDMYWSVGGAPEAVIAAAAMKCMGGFLMCREYDKDGITAINDELLFIDDLVKGHCMFAATGITDGQLLEGVRFNSRGPVTNSVFMRSESGTVRYLTTQHGN